MKFAVVGQFYNLYIIKLYYVLII